MNIGKIILGVAIGLIGLSMMIHSIGWIASIGIFLVLWSNNISQASEPKLDINRTLF